MKLFTIWDLDNCLADDHWRQKNIEWDKDGDDRYRFYNSMLEMDRLAHKNEFDLFIKIGAEPVFFTGRSEYLREPTLRWIHRQLGIVNPIMYMRPDNHRASPRDLKEVMLTKFFREHMGFGNRIIAAFDDLPPVVEMYRQHNVPAAQLAIHHDLTRAYKPEDLKV